MSATTPDALAQAVFDLLDGSATKPAGLTLLDHELLPIEQDQLPAVGVYLVEDNPETLGDTDSVGGQRRIATIRVECRARAEVGQRPTEAHRPLREWAIGVLMADETLGGLAHQLARAGYTPYTAAVDIRIVGADLDFEATYITAPLS